MGLLDIDHGACMTLTGLKARAKLYFPGNPLILSWQRRLQLHNTPSTAKGLDELNGGNQPLAGELRAAAPGLLGLGSAVSP